LIIKQKKLRQWSEKYCEEVSEIVTKEEVKKVLKGQSAYLSSEYGVKRIGLFGSYAKDVPTEKSDVDIVVEFARPIGFRFSEFAEYLESILDRKVDILTPAGVQAIRNERIARTIEENIIYV